MEKKKVSVKKTVAKKATKKAVAKNVAKKSVAKKTTAKKVAKKTEKSNVKTQKGAVKKAVDKKSVVKTKKTVKKATVKKVAKKVSKKAVLPVQESLALVNRDEHWMHAWWNVSDERKEAAQRGEAPMVLRLYNVSNDRTVRSRKRIVREIPLPSGTNTWYLEREEKGEHYAEIGTMDSTGRFRSVVRSGQAESMPILEAPKELTPEANKLFLASLGGAISLGQFLSSSELGPEEGLEAFLTGLSPASGSVLTGWQSSSASLSDSGKKDKNFRLRVRTRLVLYGETEADAKVSIRGEAWPVEKDGSFRLEMDLPEGIFELPVHAVNRDGDLSRSVKPVVVRRTE